MNRCPTSSAEDVFVHGGLEPGCTSLFAPPPFFLSPPFRQGFPVVRGPLSRSAGAPAAPSTPPTGVTVCVPRLCDVGAEIKCSAGFFSLKKKVGLSNALASCFSSP